MIDFWTQSKCEYNLGSKYFSINVLKQVVSIHIDEAEGSEAHFMDLLG